MIFGKPFKPMLLKEVPTPFNSSEYVYELKFDGIRATIHLGPQEFKIFSRSGKDITALYPELQQIPRPHKDHLIFDGEIVAFVQNKPSFAHLEEREHLKDPLKIQYFATHQPVCYIAFDCLYQNRDLTSLTLIKRQEKLHSFPENDYFLISPTFNDGQKLFRKVVKLNLEGIVAKRLDSPYEVATRSSNWLKIKNLQKSVFYVGGLSEEPQNAVASLYLGEYKDGKLYFVGKVTIGKRQKLYTKLKKLPPRQTSPFSDYHNVGVTYLPPKYQCLVTYLNRTRQNHLREATFKRR